MMSSSTTASTADAKSAVRAPLTEKSLSHVVSFLCSTPDLLSTLRVCKSWSVSAWFLCPTHVSRNACVNKDQRFWHACFEFLWCRKEPFADQKDWKARLKVLNAV